MEKEDRSYKAFVPGQTMNFQKNQNLRNKYNF